MPRASRLVLAGQAHHIIQRGNNRQAIFFEDADRRVFLSALGQALGAHGCMLHAYVLMTNHVHLLITPERDGAIGGLMQSLGRRYVGYVNRAYRRTGTLWEGRFKSTIVDAEDYVMACHRYIEANPLRAGMVTRAEDHAWSSYRRNALGRADPLLGDHACYRALGQTAAARQAAYRQIFAEALGEDVVTTLRDATQRGWVAGSPSFRRQIEAALGRRVDPPVLGRPRKARGEGEALKDALL
jgi:putative transposase